jgi:P-type Cu2+ transporter
MSSHEHGHGGQDGGGGRATSVVHVGGLHYASEKAVVERVLSNRPGVAHVEANPVAQTATVEYDPATTSVEALQRWVEECDYHCAGRSVPGHLCDPLAEEGRDAPVHDHAGVARLRGGLGERENRSLPPAVDSHPNVR